MPELSRAGAVLAVWLASTQASAQVATTPFSYTPYGGLLPVNGAVFAFFTSGFDPSGSRVIAKHNSVPTDVNLEQLGCCVVRIEFSALAIDDCVSLRVLGDPEIPWVHWTVVDTDEKAPRFLEAPTVLDVARVDPSDTYHDPSTVFVHVEAPTTDTHGVALLAARGPFGGALAYAHPSRSIAVPLLHLEPGVACFSLLAIDAAGNEGVTEVCAPIPSSPYAPAPPASGRAQPDHTVSPAESCDAGGVTSACALVAMWAAPRRRRRPPVRSSLGARHFD